MKEIVVAFDTSNYTTSCAWFDGQDGENSGMLLDVKQGELGLRQSEALFSHVRRLPDIVQPVFLLCVNATDVNGTGSGQQNGVEMLGQRRFPRPIVPQYCHKLPWLNIQGNVLQHNGRQLLFFIIVIRKGYIPCR